MNFEKIDRKISVIFATDVVDYSLHMEKDETGTVTSLRAYEKILKEAFKKHRGRYIQRRIQENSQGVGTHIVQEYKN